MSRKLVLALFAAVVCFGVLPGATSAQGSTVTLNGTAKVTTADIMASNGVIHIIDTVLMPPTMMSSTMAATSMMSGTMAATMMNATMSSTMAATSMMNSTMAATMAPAMSSTMAATMNGTMAAGSQTIADIVVGNPDFSTLLAALKAANLVDVFTKPGTYTVFAPTNEAFAAALKSNNMTAASLLADVPTLTKILTYHVVAKKLVAADLIKLTSVTTLNGADIQIAVK